MTEHQLTQTAAQPGCQPLIELLRELARAIETEIEALAQHDHEALMTATSAKRTHLASLDRFWRQNAGIANTLSDPTAPNADEIATLTDRCRTLNAAAGAAIASLSQRVAGTLALLGHGHAVAYSPHGKCTAGPVSRHAVVC